MTWDAPPDPETQAARERVQRSAALDAARVHLRLTAAEAERDGYARRLTERDRDVSALTTDLATWRQQIVQHRQFEAELRRILYAGPDTSAADTLRAVRNALAVHTQAMTSRWP